MAVDIEDNNEEELDSEDLETPNGVVFAPTFTRDSKKGDKVYKNDTPIDNAADVPLFNDADKRGMRHVVTLRVIKLNNPRSGYKGDIPPSSTLATIAQLYGDGLYTVEALNAKHQVIRTKENVRISMEDVSEAKTATSAKANADDNLIETIKELNRQHENTINRLLESANTGAKESKENANAFVKLVQTQTENTITRDREYVGAMNKGQQEFFATMMSAQSQQFQQMFMLMTMGHQHLIQALKVTYEGGNANKGSDVDTLLKGIMVAQQLGGNDDPDWLKALTTGASGLKDLLKLKEAATDNPGTKEKSDEEKPTKEKPKIPISKNELLEILRLKKELNRRGIDFGEMVRQARENLVDEEIQESDSSESKSEAPTEQTE